MTTHAATPQAGAARATEAETRDQLRAFITRELLLGRATALRDDDELLLSGLVDSLGAVRLIAFIESELGTHIPPEDVVIEHIQSIDAIVGYLKQRSIL